MNFGTIAAQTRTDRVKHVVLVGAGHAHVEALRRFGSAPPPVDFRLTLITRRRETPYSGMLPGAIAGLYRPDDMHIDTIPLCRFAKARLIVDEAIGVDLQARTVICAAEAPVPFDILSLDIGSTPNTQTVPGAGEAAIPVKPIDGFLARFEAARERMRACRGPVRIAVVGAGAGGVELLMSVERRLRGETSDPDRLRFALISATPEILPTFSRRMRRRIEAILRERGVEILAGAPVVAIGEGALTLEDGSSRRFDEIFWTTQAAAADWLHETGLALDERGFVRVEETLESSSHADIFAAGDVASLDGYDLPKSGVYAVRQGPVLAENIRRRLMGRPLVRYRPQRRALALLTTGERYAIGGRGCLVFEGRWAWRLKDWIDRRFMRKFAALPAQNGPRVVEAASSDD